MKYWLWFCWLFPAAVWGQSFQGTVVDSATGRPLPYAQVRWYPSGPGTLSNEAGGFVIKAPRGQPTDTIRISYLGYHPQYLLASQWQDDTLLIALAEAGLTLDSVHILPHQAEVLLLQALAAIPDNYHAAPVNAELFFRELIQEDDHYVELSEAVMRAYKQPPRAENSSGDQLQVLKGRRKALPMRDSTVKLRLGSGIPQALVSHPVIGKPFSFSFLKEKEMRLYQYELKGITRYQGREVYVIHFDQAEKLRKRLYRGEIFLDVQDLAFVQISYEPSPRGKKFRMSQVMGVGDQAKLTFIRLLGYRIDPQGDGGRVTCVRHDGQWYLQYVQRDMAMIIDTPEREAAAGPADVRIIGEMLFTDIAFEQRAQPIPADQRLQPGTPMKEAVGSYDATFWQNYQVIQLRPELAELFD